MMRVARCRAVTNSMLACQFRYKNHGPGDKRFREEWHRHYPTMMEESQRDMYHCYYPYMFDHGDKMSLYPKIKENPREWQPQQLQTTYDAIREDKYDSFMKIREKFPELYQDTQAWDNPPPFGDFNQFYSVRFGLVGVKAFTCKDYDEHGNQLDLTAYWFPDNQVINHNTGPQRNSVVVGATNVPVEFHPPHITANYKAKQVPVKHVCSSFSITPDAFVPVGTKLDVRHFKVGQEVDVTFQNVDYGFRGTVSKHGFDGGWVWLGDSRWQRRPGGMGAEGQCRVFPGHRMSGQTGAAIEHRMGAPVWKIDYKYGLVYLAHLIDADVGVYVKMKDTINTKGYTLWSQHRGFPAFPTFIPDAEEDLSKLPAEDCVMTSLPLVHNFTDEGPSNTHISQEDIDDAQAVKPTTQVQKKYIKDTRKYYEARKKMRKARSASRKYKMVSRRAVIAEKQEESRRAKLEKYKKVKK